MVHARQGDGQMVSSMPRALGAELTAPAAWAVNSQTNQAAVFARSADGFLYGFKVPANGMDQTEMVWPMARHDARSTATIPAEDLDPINAAQDFFIADKAFVYPNPARDEAIVRYWLGADAVVNIAIYDLAGNRVIEWSGTGSGGGDNEWTWPGGSGASGQDAAAVERGGVVGGDGTRMLALITPPEKMICSWSPPTKSVTPARYGFSFASTARPCRTRARAS